MHSPIGDLTVSAEDEAIVAVDWGWGRDQTRTPLLETTVARLHAYFGGAAIDFTDLPIAPVGTAYRCKVWAALRKIPRGDVISYRTLAHMAGGSARSVGQANAANPVPILIPCHRVVAAAGLGGYSGPGGLSLKRHLLALEGASDLRITHQ